MNIKISGITKLRTDPNFERRSLTVIDHVFREFPGTYILAIPPLWGGGGIFVQIEKVEEFEG